MTGIDKEKQKKKERKVIIIIGIILYVIVVLAFLHGAAIKYDNPRAGLEDLLMPSFMEIFTNPLHMRFTKEIFLIIFLGTGMGIALLILSIGNKNLKKHDNPDPEEARFMNQSDLDSYNMSRTEPFGKTTHEGRNNMIISKDVFLSMDGFKSRRNCNILTIGGSGAGKSRFFASPNILQFNSNFIITDPSGELLQDYGKALEDVGYKVKVFNLVDVYRSNKYNPFHYIKTEKDVFILVNTLIQNTTPSGKSGGDPFWEKSEKLLLNALILYLWHTQDESKQTFTKVGELLNKAQVDENNPDAESPLDIMFASLEKSDKNNLAVRQYKKFKLGAGKTLKSILISVGVRLESFDLEDIAYLTSEDEMDFDHFADTKQALFVVIPTADTTFNFLVSLMYAQLFMSLYNYVETRVQFGWEAYTNHEIIKVVQAKDAKKSLEAKKEIEAFKKAVSAGTKIVLDKKKKLYRLYTSDKKYQIGWRGRKEDIRKLQEEVRSLKIRQLKGSEFRKCPNHMRFILDEFANIGQIPNFIEKVATIRKYSISVSIIIQALSQLKTMYKDDWNTLVGNCDTKLFLGSDDGETMQWLCDSLGKKTIIKQGMSFQGNGNGSTSLQQTKEELMPVDRIALIKDNECIVKIRGHHPFFGKKYELTDHPNYKFAKSTAGEFKIPVSKGVEERIEGPWHLRKSTKEGINSAASAAGDAENPVQENKKPDKKEDKKDKNAAGNDSRKDAANNALKAAKEMKEEERLKEAEQTTEESLAAAFGGMKDGDTDETIKERVFSTIDLQEPPMETFLYSQTQ